jgi:hypothetical protein
VVRPAALTKRCTADASGGIIPCSSDRLSYSVVARV